jgi:hypothetical protein
MVVTLGKKKSNMNRLIRLFFKFLMSQLLFAFFFFFFLIRSTYWLFKLERRRKKQANRLIGLFLKISVNQLLFRMFFSSFNKINIMVVKLGKKRSNKSKRVELIMSFLDELKNIMVVEAKASTSGSKRVKSRICFRDET